MIYTVMKQNPAYIQMTLEDFLYGNTEESALFRSNYTCTRTFKSPYANQKLLEQTDIPSMIRSLYKFNRSTDHIRELDRHSLYSEFFIPKKKGGLRKIDAPNQELKETLRTLKKILESFVVYKHGITGALYHTSAFAYIEGRCTVDSLKRHQANNSKWYAKYDLSNFFGSTTLEYTLKMFKNVYPFSEICKGSICIPESLTRVSGENELRTALELAFLDGGLPQGTPISPLITNIIMIPVDHELCNTLHNYERNTYIYTRYADDFLVSSRYDFSPKNIETLIKDTLSKFEAPFTIKAEKTRYGSSAGKNWNLGLMINANNDITVGSKNKRRFHTMLFNYAKDYVNGIRWDLSDVQALEGLRNYYRKVEGKTIDEIVENVNKKVGCDTLNLIKSDLSIHK